MCAGRHGFAFQLGKHWGSQGVKSEWVFVSFIRRPSASAAKAQTIVIKHSQRENQTSLPSVMINGPRKVQIDLSAN